MTRYTTRCCVSGGTSLGANIAIKHCQRQFNFNLSSDILAIRCEQCEARYRLCDDVFANICLFFSMHTLS